MALVTLVIKANIENLLGCLFSPCLPEAAFLNESHRNLMFIRESATDPFIKGKFCLQRTVRGKIRTEWNGIKSCTFEVFFFSFCRVKCLQRGSETNGRLRREVAWNNNGGTFLYKV